MLFSYLNFSCNFFFSRKVKCLPTRANFWVILVHSLVTVKPLDHPKGGSELMTKLDVAGSFLPSRTAKWEKKVVVFKALHF